MSSNIKIKKICEFCGTEFIARTTVTKYCGDICAKRAYKAKVREEKIKASQAETEKPDKTINRIERDKGYFNIKTLDYLTVKEAAALLKCDKRTIYRMVISGRIPSANLSIRRIRILKKDIDGLFEIRPYVANNTPTENSENLEWTPLKDCFTIGQIQKEYSISETSLKSLIARHNIPKFQKGKFVYVPKVKIEHLLKRILLGKYSG